MKFLKALVAGMGVLILTGTVFLVYGLIQNGGKLTRSDSQPQIAAPLSSASPAALPQPEPAAPYEARIPLRDGEEVDLIGLAGRYLLLRIISNQQNERIITFDPATGRIVGTILMLPNSAPETLK